jgi:hypothetical protein
MRSRLGSQLAAHLATSVRVPIVVRQDRFTLSVELRPAVASSKRPEQSSVAVGVVVKDAIVFPSVVGPDPFTGDFEQVRPGQIALRAVLKDGLVVTSLHGPDPDFGYFGVIGRGQITLRIDAGRWARLQLATVEAVGSPPWARARLATADAVADIKAAEACVITLSRQ